MAYILLVLLFSLRLQGDATSGGCKGKKFLRFEDYQVTIAHESKPHLPILATALDRKYRTRIRDAAAAGANFAGHFAIADWGCGTGCLEFVIVDVRAGVVFDPPFDEIDSHYPPTPDYDPGWQCYQDMVTYQRDSKLLVIEGCLHGKQCGRTYLTMEDGKLRQLAYDPDLLPDGKVAPY